MIPSDIRILLETFNTEIQSSLTCFISFLPFADHPWQDRPWYLFSVLEQLLLHDLWQFLFRWILDHFFILNVVVHLHTQLIILPCQEEWLPVIRVVILSNVYFFATGPQLLGKVDFYPFFFRIQQLFGAFWLQILQVECFVNKVFQCHFGVLFILMSYFSLENCVNQFVNTVEGELFKLCRWKSFQ